jgi:molecular chaperone GrpE
MTNDTNNEEMEEPDEEIVPEEETTQSGKITSLKNKLKECKKERKEYLNGWQRAKADLMNKKKEFTKKKEEIRTYANTNLIEDIIPALDSFQMAFADTNTWESVDEEWRTGIEQIHSQLVDILRSHGVRLINPDVGDEFDPHIHEAKEESATDTESKDNTIESVQKRGYKLEERIIRPAFVVVNKLKESDN